ncbi:MAG TPA: hypothetical protein VFG62_00200 [Rhodopila sp.]|nr:hypothetical protein [Rhodopila sp.]
MARDPLHRRSPAALTQLFIHDQQVRVEPGCQRDRVLLGGDDGADFVTHVHEPFREKCPDHRIIVDDQDRDG